MDDASLDDLGELPVVQRANLKDQIASALRAEILAGRMRPGTTYKMGELAVRFGASRTPMREAILELENKRLVEIIRGVGFRVLAPSSQELRDNLQIREMLEAPAVALIAGRLSAAELAKARDLVQQVHDAAEVNDLTRYLDSDRQFHLYLMSRTGNERLVSIVEDLRDAQRMPGLARIANEGTLVERNQDHIELLDAIETGDGQQAAEIIRRHLELSRLAFAPSPTDQHQVAGSQ